jgi:hypothetical protein
LVKGVAMDWPSLPRWHLSQRERKAVGKGIALTKTLENQPCALCMALIFFAVNFFLSQRF